MKISSVIVRNFAKSFRSVLAPDHTIFENVSLISYSLGETELLFNVEGPRPVFHSLSFRMLEQEFLIMKDFTLADFQKNTLDDEEAAVFLPVIEEYLSWYAKACLVLE